MQRFPMRCLILFASTALSGGAARADVYGFVDGGRVSVVISDTRPADPRYTLFKKDAPGHFNELPDLQAGGDRPAPTSYSAHILAAAKATDVEAALIRAVISIESGFNPAARSRAGAVGLMQLMPETARRYGVTDRLDPSQNIHGGARYLRDLQAMFGNNLQLVLAAYNAGEEAVMRYGMRIPPYRETAAYVPKVLGQYRKFRGAAQPVSGG